MVQVFENNSLRGQWDNFPAEPKLEWAVWRSDKAFVKVGQNHFPWILDEVFVKPFFLTNYVGLCVVVAPDLCEHHPLQHPVTAQLHNTQEAVGGNHHAWRNGS